MRSFGLPPYVDGSCRREPDFESAFPSITALCRFTLFAPRLHEGDCIAYITVKGCYAPLKDKHWRLVAILRVLERFAMHDQAAAWYREQALKLPSNCMVNANPPLPLEKTLAGRASLQRWDAVYRFRAGKCGVFLVCRPDFLELHEPPALTHETMMQIFGRIPGTLNPPRITDDQIAQLRELALRKTTTAPPG